jgi:hypothetical protein
MVPTYGRIINEKEKNQSNRKILTPRMRLMHLVKVTVALADKSVTAYVRYLPVPAAKRCLSFWILCETRPGTWIFLGPLFRNCTNVEAMFSTCAIYSTYVSNGVVSRGYIAAYSKTLWKLLMSRRSFSSRLAIYKKASMEEA